MLLLVSGLMMSEITEKKILETSRPDISVNDFSINRLISMIQQCLTGKAVSAAFLFGSVASGRVGNWSDVDIIIVKDTKEVFVERPREFFNLLDIGVPFDILVYTPEEFASLKADKEGFWGEVSRDMIKIV